LSRFGVIPPEIWAALMLLLAAAVSVGVVRAAATTPHLVPLTVPTATPTTAEQSGGPRFVTGPLTGDRAIRTVAHRAPVAAVVDNYYPSARPQSGLSRASLVFETVTEAGITRLLAFYLEHDATDVGPIRSTRPYFDDLAAGYQAILVHAGGSPTAEALLPRLRTLQSVDALTARPEFHRDASRPSPDNLYTSTAGVRVVAASGTAPAGGPAFALRHSATLRTTAHPTGHIHIDFSTPQVTSAPTYAVDYRYDAARHLYARSVGGVPDIDRSVNRQINVSNVVVLYTAIHPIPNDALGRVSVKTIGTGKALLFRDGRLVRCTWSKTVPSAPLTIDGSHGRQVPLARGNTWVELTALGGATWSAK
jgi:hypothetical protein